MFETGHLPVYYLPREDVRFDLLEPTDKSTHCPYKGDARYWSLVVGDRTSKDAAWGYPEPVPGAPDIAGYVAFYWNRVDAWYEEDDEAFVHARDPYHRVDVLRSSRHVVVKVGGQVVAESHRPSVLVETHLPRRYYLPAADVRLDLLEPSDTTSRCPYKGQARYWSVEAGGTRVADVAWSYPAPIPEASKIESLICFFNERVELEVDGVVQERPRTPWS
jgi:uncharacterized protein (DUF427 family)